MGLLKDIGDRLKAIPSEVASTLTDKVIPQGATEVVQAIYAGHAFTPYGSAQQPLDIEGPQMSYQDTLRDAAQRGGQEHGQEIER